MCSVFVGVRGGLLLYLLNMFDYYNEDDDDIFLLDIMSGGRLFGLGSL